MKRLILALAFLSFALPSLGQAIRVPSRGVNGTTPESICIPPCADGESLVWDAGSSCFDCVPSTWLQGVNGVYTPINDGYIVGIDAAFGMIDGGVGDLKVSDDIELRGSIFVSAGAGQAIYYDPANPFFVQTTSSPLTHGYFALSDAECIISSSDNASSTVVLESQATTGGSVALSNDPLNAGTDTTVFSVSDDVFLFDPDDATAIIRLDTGLDQIEVEGTTADAYEFYLNFPDLAAAAADRNVTLPSAAPVANYVVQTDGSGVWTYADAGALIEASGGYSGCRVGSTEPGGILCKDATQVSLGDQTVVNHISDPLTDTDPDGGDPVDDQTGAAIWELACEDGGAGADDGYTSCVIGIAAATQAAYSTNNAGPTLLLYGADAAGEDGIAQNAGNTIVLANGSLAGSQLPGGGGGSVWIANQHKDGVLSLATRSPDNISGKWAEFLMDPEVGTGNDSNALTQAGLGSLNVSTPAWESNAYDGMFAILNTAAESNWAADKSNMPLVLGSTCQDSAVMIVEGQYDADEYYIYYEDIGSGDRKITYPDVSGTVQIAGHRRQLAIEADIDNISQLHENMYPARANAAFGGSTGFANAQDNSSDGAFVELKTDVATPVSGETAWISADHVTRFDWLPDVTWVVRTGSDVGNATYWLVLIDDNEAAGDIESSDSPDSNLAGFRMQDGSNWEACTNDAAGGVTCSTLQGVGADTVYTLRMVWTSTTAVEFWVNNVFKARRTTDLPSVTANVGPWVGVRTKTTAAKALDFGRMTLLSK